MDRLVYNALSVMWIRCKSISSTCMLLPLHQAMICTISFYTLWPQTTLQCVPKGWLCDSLLCISFCPPLAGLCLCTVTRHVPNILRTFNPHQTIPLCTTLCAQVMNASLMQCWVCNKVFGAFWQTSLQASIINFVANSHKPLSRHKQWNIIDNN
jgi:hypothetical protein